MRSRAIDFLRRRASERADTAVEIDSAFEEAVPGDAANPMDVQQASEAAWALHECCASWKRGSGPTGPVPFRGALVPTT